MRGCGSGEHPVPLPAPQVGLPATSLPQGRGGLVVEARTVSRWDPDPDEVRDVRPYDYAGAKRAHARASRDMTDSEGRRKKAAKDLAEKEREYRKGLAVKMVALHAEGVGWSTTETLAKGDEHVAQLRYERDVAKGVLDAAEQEAWKHTANRRGLDALVDWSKRVAPLGDEPEPNGAPKVYGAHKVRG